MPLTFAQRKHARSAVAVPTPPLFNANHANNCPQTTAMPLSPQGQTIGGEKGKIFLHAWREKALRQIYQAPSRDPSIVAALKKEYQDFYQSIGISRTAEEAKNALAGANPNKKRKQAVTFLLLQDFVMVLLFNLTFVEQECNANRAKNLTPAEREAKAAYKHNWKKASVLFCACMPILKPCRS